MRTRHIGAVFTAISAFSLAGATPAAAVVTTSSAANGLEALRELNLIVLGNWSASQDVEGKTYVGGNASGSTVNLGIGNGNYGEKASARPTLTIGGSSSIGTISINNGSNGKSGQVATSPGAVIVGNSGALNLNAQGSSLLVGGNLSGTYNVGSGAAFSVGGNLNGGINGSSGAAINVGGRITGNVNANGAAIKQNLGIGFNAAQLSGITSQTAQLGADLNRLSSRLDALTVTHASSISTLGSRATLNAVDGGNGYSVFNVTSAFFTQYSEIDYNFPSTTLPVIINVHGGTTINYNLNAVGGDTSAADGQVIWNFIDATVINFNRMLHGSVLGLKATVSNSTAIEGSIAVQNFNQGGEVHLGTYAGNDSFIDPNAPLPEPGVWIELIAGFGLAGGLLRRQRRANSAIARQAAYS